jgi:metal-dependent amidase/aminoacylase/carboxypeptidase family protein
MRMSNSDTVLAGLDGELGWLRDTYMHACGHDAHIATLLGAAKLMADGRGAWAGTYIALFQPAEEVGAGSKAMVDDGLVTKVPRPDVGSMPHIIPDRATLLLNIRTYDNQVPATVLAAIERIVKGECVTAAFRAHFGAEAVRTAGRQTASEDFSRIPDAFGVPYTFWLLGGVDPAVYQAAVAKGTVAQDIPANHSPFFAPVIDPTLSMGVQAQVVAALSYLSKEAQP